MPPLAAVAAAASAASSTLWQALRPALRPAGLVLSLGKFRLSTFVAASAAGGFVLGSGEAVDWARCAALSAGTLLTAMSAAAWNQIAERRQDALMLRTRARPLPSQRLIPATACAAALGMGSGGLALLLVSGVGDAADGKCAEPPQEQRGGPWPVITQGGLTAAALGAANIVLYGGVYTQLKVLHPINTWVGAVVGAVPPLMGWAAAAGSLSAGAMPLAAALYFWQLPHFMALSWINREDYARGGFRMMAVSDLSGARTAAVALRNCLYLMPLGAAAVTLNVTTLPFAAEAAALSFIYAAGAYSFWRAPSAQTARVLFRRSLVYLPLFLIAMLFHRRPQIADKDCVQGAPAFPGDIDADIPLGAVMHQALWRGREGELPPLLEAPFPLLPAPNPYLSDPNRSRRRCEPQDSETRDGGLALP